MARRYLKRVLNISPVVVCWPQVISAEGSGLFGFKAELSKWPVATSSVPAGKCNGLASSYVRCQAESNSGTDRIVLRSVISSVWLSRWISSRR